MCEVRIYGKPMNEGVTYKLESVTTQVIEKPFEPIMKEDKAQDFVTYVDETHTIKGREGYVVEAYLVGYVDGRAVSRDLVSTDTYPAKADTIYTGTKFRY